MKEQEDLIENESIFRGWFIFFGLQFFEVFVKKCTVAIWYMWGKKVIKKCVYRKYKFFFEKNNFLNKCKRGNKCEYMHINCKLHNGWLIRI